MKLLLKSFFTQIREKIEFKGLFAFSKNAFFSKFYEVKICFYEIKKFVKSKVTIIK